MERSSLIPGFRFHPTDVELVMYYLKRKLSGKKIITNAVAEVNIYDFSPWDLPDKSSLRSGDLEWFFFCPKARKYLSGSRSNRATEIGFWKATGKDRLVKYKERTVAMIKTLVFHLGNAPNGKRTDWVMHEYSMKDEDLAKAEIAQDMYVLCKIFQKSGAGPKNGAQYGAPFKEEEWDDDEDRRADPATMDMTVPHSFSTEPGSSVVMSCANETTKKLATNTMNMTVPQSSLSVDEAGSSTLTFSAPANDDVLLFQDIASILGVSTKDVNSENQVQGVEIGKEQARSEEDLGIYDDLVNLINLDDLNSDKFKTGAEYTILRTDDLDADLRDFYVD